MSDRFRDALQGAWKRIEERQWVYGAVGRLNADSSYTYEVPGRKNFIYVTVRVAGGAQTVVPARNDARVPKVPKLAVKMKLEYGVYVIHGKTGRKEIGVTEVSEGDVGSLLALTDTPDSYVGQTGKVLAVNATEDALEFSDAPGGAVDSVNGQTGAVSLDTDDIDEGTTNQYLDAANLGTTIAGASSTGTLNDTDKIPLVMGTTVLWAAWSTIKSALTSLFDSLYVGLTGNQSIAGTKTFNEPPVVDKNQNAGTMIHAKNLNAGASAQIGVRIETDSTNMYFGAASAANTAFQGGGFVYTNANVPLSFWTTNTMRMILTGSGLAGLGTSSPQGKFHVHDGASGWLFVSKSNINDTPQVIIPDGTGDVTAGLFAIFIASSGASGSQGVLLGGDVPIISGLTSINLRVNANGSVDIRRTSGTGVFSVTLFLVWR